LKVPKTSFTIRGRTLKQGMIMKTTKRILFFGFYFGLATTLANCSTATTDAETSTTGLRFNAAADFESSAVASLAALTTGTCDDLDTPITRDDPILTDGLDCDADDGVVAHVTPSRYVIAFKRVTLLGSDENTSDIELVTDTGTLAASEVVVFTQDDATNTLITLSADDLAAGTYSGIEVEMYYFEMTFAVAGIDQNVRIYMSDDDFEAEGNLGHHQGDITFISDDGTEAGWADSTWLEANLSNARGDEQNGAGGTDAETGHARGFFGDATLWNGEDFNQGSAQDIYTTSLLFAEALVIPEPAAIDDLTTVTATFSVADTFYYEDFAPQGTGFFPDTGGEATSEGAEWAPQTPQAELSVL
jgi:hypothetical protein